MKNQFDDKMRARQKGRELQDAHANNEDDNLPMIVYGRNPVKEAIKSGRSIDKIFIDDTGSDDGSLRELLRMARERSLVVLQISRAKLDAMTMPYGYDGKPAPHQGIIAQLPAIEYVEVSDILSFARDKGESPFLLLLDSISDPHNLGAIIRSAECAGIHGIVIPKRRSVSVNATVAKASAGAVMHMKIARVPNLSQCIEMLKKENIWIAGADMQGQAMYQAPMKGALALLLGSEGDGLSPLLRKNCDFLVSIPMQGELNSLNVSNAAAILIYEKLRQDRA